MGEEKPYNLATLEVINPIHSSAMLKLDRGGIRI